MPLTTSDREPPFEGGAQPVPNHPDEVPKRGPGLGQVGTIVLCVLVVVAAVVWYFK